ncbi:MAG TPA: type IV toxin-antitoxin system AbiEi family antitoxin [Gammaproteobacteria bacterium]|nr:type IV toxin-antitoxin system AbiEi family antitoxin [Gammaproteobacteria bacterium]
MNISHFLTTTIAKGNCCFAFTQAEKELGASPLALRAALRRLKQKGELAQPVHGFYVIVPPEYRILGCRPAEHFIHQLMQYLHAPYYVGLLSAAQHYGAAHHRPQQYQVVTNHPRRYILCGRIKIVFITKQKIEKTPTQPANTPQGIIIISTPEATTMDMVMYPHRCAGLDNVLTVLTDLVKKLDPNKLLQLTTDTDQIAWIQRLGYLLDLINAKDLSNMLHNSIKNHHANFRTLTATTKKSPALKKLIAKLEKERTVVPRVTKNKKWKLIINRKLEAEE